VASVHIGSVAFECSCTQVPNTPLWRIIEVAERVLAAALLALSTPVLFLAAVAVVVLSKRCPLVAHRRVTQGGRTLWLLKLRTMWATGGARDRGAGIRLIERLPAVIPDTHSPKIPSDPRVTSAFAVLCRRYSLDELPQLWHVVRGEMALIGPRPLTRYELDRYYGPETVKVLSRKAGLSGLWQIRGRSRLDYRKRRRLDIFLIEKWSVRVYFRILLATFPRVLSGKDAW
jgi:lipopolysaccharide/colanic/teichoic acid biosynthesis glycosyltransferase